ncbi:MAG TPA: long-chain fatty acid--CoA ligase [Candidatus Dormibacteraeota bacterium]|nr:long-chain fatty acid--CoA ligase [Candidatus Dormibacteraeota bacterium]
MGVEMVSSSRHLSIPVAAADVSPETTVGLLLKQAERFRPRTLLRFYDEPAQAWRAVSWDEFRDRVLLVAQGLIDTGLKPGDRVLLLSENRFEWLLCDVGIQAGGGVTVPVYANLIASSVQAIAEDSGASLAIVADAGQAAKLSGMRHPPRVLSIETDVKRWLGEPGAGWPDVRDRLVTLSPEDVATIAYTSGTTGKPKGVVLTHRIVVAEVQACLKAYDIRPDDITLSILPYAHILERVAGFYFAGVLAGAQLNLGRGLDHLVEDIKAVRPTCMEAVPRLFEKVEQQVQDRVRKQSRPAQVLFRWAVATGRKKARSSRPGPWLRLRYAIADRLALRRLRDNLGGRLRFFVCGSAPLLAEVEEFFWAIGLPIYQGWGQTEVTGIATVNTIAEHRFGTVGRCLPGFEIRLAPDGEIEVRGPGVMKEYHHNPEATAQVLSDGWIRTGDVGSIDQDGFLTITDRKKDLIKTSGGKYVAPQPIEAQLQLDPHIQTAVVVGEGRKYVTALIVPNWPLLMKELGLDRLPEKLVDDPSVRAVVQRRVDVVNKMLDRFETVKYFQLLPRALTIETDEMTPTLKVKRRVVQDHYRDLIDLMYASPV